MEPRPTASSRSERRAARRRRVRVRGALAGVTAIALVVGAVLLLSGAGDDGRGARLANAGEVPLSTAPTTVAPTTTAAPPSSLIATTKGEPLQVFDAAAGTNVVTTLAAKSDYGLPRTLLVTDRQPEWLHVLLPMRPNESTGWIREADVTLSTTTTSVKVDLAAHLVTVFDGANVVLQAPTVIGKPATPTPTGTYYVTDPVDLRSRPNGAYGAFALGLSAYSEVLMHFNGGPGQIAIHGTTATSLLGQDQSNGCVRVANDVIVQIADHVVLGTPVTIA